MGVVRPAGAAEDTVTSVSGCGRVGAKPPQCLLSKTLRMAMRTALFFDGSATLGLGIDSSGNETASPTVNQPSKRGFPHACTRHSGPAGR